MKHTIATISAILLPCLAAAQPVAGPYVSLGGGLNLQADDIVAPTPGVFPGPISYHFDPGFAGQVSAGYGVGNGFRAEIEGDFLTNHVKSVSGPSYPARAGGYDQNYGGMANVLYDLPGTLGLNPYLGAGFGGQDLSLHDVSFGSIYAHQKPLTGANSSQSVTGYAYQGIAGVAVPLPYMPGLSFTAEYRFLGLIDPLQAFHRDVDGVAINRRFGNDLNNSIMFGLRFAFGAPPPPPPMQAAPPPPAREPAAPATRTYLVFFDWDRADLTERARAIVAEAAQASTHLQTTKIEVNGYTDLSGTVAYNQKLSVRRAETVQAELVRDGVARNEIAIHGYGESNPLVPTAPGVREPQNRRVEIILD